MPNGQRPWRDSRTWQRRVVRDRQLLRERLDDDQMTVVHGVVEAADPQGALDFVVVFGSVARGVGALRAGQEFAFNVVRDGLVHVDNGRYREVLIAVDEEGLVPNDRAREPA